MMAVITTIVMEPKTIVAQIVFSVLKVHHNVPLSIQSFVNLKEYLVALLLNALDYFIVEIDVEIAIILRVHQILDVQKDFLVVEGRAQKTHHIVVMMKQK